VTRGRIVAITLVFFSVMVLITVAFFVVDGVRDMRRDRLLRSTIEEVDALLADGRFEDAGRRLREFRSVALERDQWIRVLRRSYAVSREPDGLEGFMELSAAAAADHPGDPELSALEQITRLRSGEAVSLDSVPAGERFDSIRGAVLVSPPTFAADVPSEDVDVPESSIEAPAVAAAVSAAYRRTPASQQRAFEALGDVRFAGNAALLRLASGEARRAYEAAAGAAERLPSRFRAELALAAGEFDFAEALLRDGPSTAGAAELEARTFLLGDALLARGRTAEAARSYRREAATEWSPEVYQNLAYIRRLRGESPRERLEVGRNRHPSDPELARALALTVLEETGDMEQARKVLADVPAGAPRVELTRALVLEESRGGRRVPALLWRMYNNALESGGSAALFGEYLAWHLTGIRDWAELERVIEKGGGDWSAFYRGVTAVRAGRYAEARNAFSAVSSFRMEYAAWYNRGILAAAAGELDRAQQQLERALHRIRSGPGAAEETAHSSRVLEALGRVHLLKGNEETGYRMLSQALDRDPGNAGARNLLDGLRQEPFD
jgi:tetratricopeptide (TPR) repeat protein